MNPRFLEVCLSGEVHRDRDSEKFESPDCITLSGPATGIRWRPRVQGRGANLGLCCFMLHYQRNPGPVWAGTGKSTVTLRSYSIRQALGVRVSPASPLLVGADSELGFVAGIALGATAPLWGSAHWLWQPQALAMGSVHEALRKSGLQGSGFGQVNPALSLCQESNFSSLPLDLPTQKRSTILHRVANLLVFKHCKHHYIKERTS